MLCRNSGLMPASNISRPYYQTQSYDWCAILSDWRTLIMHWSYTKVQEINDDKICFKTEICMVMVIRSVITLWETKTMTLDSLITMLMGPTWGPSGADRTQVGPMLAPLPLLFGLLVRNLCVLSHELTSHIGIHLMHKNEENCQVIHLNKNFTW